MTDRKVAFVTGASSGIGRATAEAFVARGYATVLVDCNADDGMHVQAALGAIGECAFIRCDVSDEDGVRAAVQRAVRTYGRLDACFNAAGVTGDLATTAEGTLENWSRVIAVDLTAVWLCMRHQIPELQKTGGGAIVNCASMAGLVGASHMSAYVAAKHGVIGLTKTAAVEYARQGVRVNAVCPGLIDTPMTRSLASEAAAAMIESGPMGRIGAPAEVADVVLWLCSEASSYVNGQSIAIDGGMTMR